METSAVFKASQQPIASPDGLHVASVIASRLQIRSTATHDIFRSITLPVDGNTKFVSFRWAPISQSQPWSYRLLLADGDNVRAWDLRDPKWTASINNGSGGTGRIVHADFGHTMDEVLVASDFGSKLTIWSLLNGRSVEIKDPKFPSSRGHAFRPAAAGVAKALALLSRPGPQDLLTLHAPRSHEVIRSINLPTHDAQGLKWSPDGRWLAIWDSPSVGCKIYIYTADGHLYRVYGGEFGDNQQLGLGVKSLEWSPRSNFLAVGGHDRTTVMLSTRTFSPLMFLEHAPSIEIEDGEVWQEQVSASSKHTYSSATQPIAPPLISASSSDTISKSGVSMHFNADGSLLATRDDAVPTAVWIWDLETLKPRSVLLQHASVKKLAWHPIRADLLLITCFQEKSVLYLWSSLTDSPMVLAAPLSGSSSKLECQWLNTKGDKKPAIIAGDSSGFLMLWPDGRDPPAEEESEQEPGVESDVDESLDSVVEMLAGRTPLPAHMETADFGRTIDSIDENAASAFEDTFRGKRRVGMT